MKSKFILFASALLLTATANAQQNVSTNGTKYVLITDGTGAWCQFCSDGVAVMEDDIMPSHPKAIPVAIHNASSGGHPDAMEIPDGEAFNNAFCLGPLGYPYGTVDCHFYGLNGNPGQDTVVGLNRGLWVTAVTTAEGFTSTFDISMSHSFDQATKELTVNVTGNPLADLTGTYNINVLLLEDSVTGTGNAFNQQNYYNSTVGHKFYQKGSPITNFQHMHVLRAMLGGTWGVALATDPKKDGKVSKEFKYTIPATYSNSDGSSPANTNRMHLVAYVQKAATGSKTNNKNMDIQNSVAAKMLPWNATSVAKVNNFAELSVFPNPAADYIVVRAQLNTPAEVKIDIKNAIGQTVFTQSYPVSGSLFGETINTNYLNDGMYYLTVTSEGISNTQKIAISK